MERKIWAIAGAVIIILLVITLTLQDKKEEIEIGGIFALTGYGSEWGTAEYKAAKLAIEEANLDSDTQFSLIAEDSQTKSTEAINAIKKLININQVEFIIGTTWESDSTAIAPVAADSKTLLISPSSYKGIQDLNSEYTFSTYPPYEYGITSLAPYFESQDTKNFVIIYDQEFFSEILKDLFEEQAQLNNWNILGVYGQNPSDRDYRTSLLKIKNLENVDAIYTPLSNDDPNKGLLMTQIKELDLQIPVFSTASTENNNLLKNFPESIEGIFYSFPTETPLYQEFSKKYEEKYGEKPESPSAATAYDAASLLIQAINSGAETPEEASEYLHNIKDYQGASNVITFDDKGIISNKEYIVKTVRDGKFVEV